LRAEDDVVFGLAEAAARARQSSTWEALLERLPKLSADRSAFCLQQLLGQADGTRIAMALQIARGKIDLGSLASEPSTDLVGGPSESNAHVVLQVLARFPGHAEDLAEAGLKNRVVGVRSSAVNVLYAWPRQVWSAGLESALRDALQAEPVADLQERMRAVLDGRAPS